MDFMEKDWPGGWGKALSGSESHPVDDADIITVVASYSVVRGLVLT